ncbi:YxeA family protein [Bacillus cereus]|nr:YxeA family protein [Bacillus cereus]
MKKIIIGTVAVITIGLGVLICNKNGDLDRFNPFEQEKDVYVLSKTDGTPDASHSGRKYKYLLNGVDASGKENEIKVTTDTKDSLGKNQYFKVSVKGQYVFKYEEVQDQDVPEKAKEKLNK